VGFYRDRLLPRLQDKLMSNEQMREVRARVCAPLSGDVVEVGFGTGLNVPYYPAEVARVRAVEPSSMCRRISEPRRARSGVPIDDAGLTGESLDLGSESVDAALSTWTLCTIPDLEAALAELLRVLRPGGSFHFVEHGRAPDPGVARWQGRIEPVWKPVAGGCHLTRPIADVLVDAGFTIDRLDTYYLEEVPRPFGFTFEGHAVKT